MKLTSAFCADLLSARGAYDVGPLVQSFGGCIKPSETHETSTNGGHTKFAVKDDKTGSWVFWSFVY